MNVKHSDSTSGVEASLAELILVRPDAGITGFAPGGKVSTHQFGTNRSVFRGRGIEFDEARVYQPGDDIKTIDWRVTARTGTVHTKLFHEERERPVLVLVDCRSMMHFGSRVCFKSVLAARLAAMLCWVGIDGGDRVGGFVLGKNGERHFSATRRRASMLTFLAGISAATCTSNYTSKTACTSKTDSDVDLEVPLHLALRRLRHVCRPGTLAFIISDYADFDDLVEGELKRLAVHAHVTNLLVYDRLDEALPEQGDYRISDGQGVISLAGLGKKPLREYQQAFAHRKEKLKTLSRQRRMAFMDIATSEDPKKILTPHRKIFHRQNQNHGFWGNVA